MNCVTFFVLTMLLMSGMFNVFFVLKTWFLGSLTEFRSNTFSYDLIKWNLNKVTLESKCIESVS